MPVQFSYMLRRSMYALKNRYSKYRTVAFAFTFVSADFCRKVTLYKICTVLFASNG